MLKKEKEPCGCIYHVVNTLNRKGYVGKYHALNVEHRWNGHLKAARYGSKHMFHCALRKYKYEKGFTWEVVWHGPLSRLNEKEKYYIKKLRTHVSFSVGYNLTWGGEGCLLTGAPLRKRNKSIKAAWANDPTKREEHGNKLREVFSTSEQRAARSEARKADWANPAYRKKMLKIRREQPSRLGQSTSPEARAILSEKITKWWSTRTDEERKEFSSKQSKAQLKSFKDDPNRRAALSAAVTAWWAKKSPKDRRATAARKAVST